MLIVRETDGVELATGVLGHFACALEARRFAVAYGMAQIDHRHTPEPEWPAIYSRKGRDPMAQPTAAA